MRTEDGTSFTPFVTITFFLCLILAQVAFWLLKVGDYPKAMIGVSFCAVALGIAIGLIGLSRNADNKVCYSQLAGLAAIMAPSFLARTASGGLGTVTVQTGREESETLPIRDVPASEYLFVQGIVEHYAIFLVALGAVSVYLWLRRKRAKSEDQGIAETDLNWDGWFLGFIAVLLSRQFFSY